jgi:hypothetical protein
MIKFLLSAIAVIVLVFGGGAYYKKQRLNSEIAAAAALAEKQSQELAKRAREAEAATEKEAQQLAVAQAKEAEEAVRLQNARKSEAVEIAKAAVGAKLKDPFSVQYRNVRVAFDVAARDVWTDLPFGDRITFVCGEYNAKNGFGAYAGFHPFQWDSGKAKAWITDLEAMREFVDPAIKQNCDKLAPM